MTQQQQEAVRTARLVLKAAGLDVTALVPPLAAVPSPGDLLSIRTAALAVSYSRQTIYRWLAAGLPSVGRGDRRRIRRADLEAFAATWANTGAVRDTSAGTQASLARRQARKAVRA